MIHAVSRAEGGLKGLEIINQRVLFILRVMNLDALLYCITVAVENDVVCV